MRVAKRKLTVNDLPELKALLERNGWKVKVSRGGLECTPAPISRKMAPASISGPSLGNRTTKPLNDDSRAIPAQRKAYL